MQIQRGRADLLALLDRHGEARLDALALVLGYEPLPTNSLAQRLSPSDPTSLVLGESLPVASPELFDPTPPPSPPPTPPKPAHPQPRQARYFRVIAHRTFETDAARRLAPVWFTEAQAFNEYELYAAADSQGLPPQAPLMPWTRLWPFLKLALGAWQTSQSPDVSRIVEHLSREGWIGCLPRAQRRAWAGECQLIIDFAEPLLPFWSDFGQLRRRLSTMRGRLGLAVYAFPDGEPSGRCQRWDGKFWQEQAYRLPPPATPVLVLSDLGCNDAAERRREPWQRFGERLRHAGCQPVALMPCPPRCWDNGLARLFQLVCWDRKPRPPKYLGISARSYGTGLRLMQDVDAETLLALLSPAMRVEPALLRAVRHLAGVDVGSEVAAWNHTAVRANHLFFRHTPKALEYYRKNFMRLDLDRRELAELIICHHAVVSPAILHEERLSLADLGVLSEAEIEDSRCFMQRLVKTYHTDDGELAEDIAAWETGMAKRHTQEAWRREERVALWLSVFAQGRKEGEKLELPPGMDPGQAQWLLDAHQTPRTFLLCQRDGDLWLETSTQPQLDKIEVSGHIHVQPIQSETPPYIIRIGTGNSFRIPIPASHRFAIRTCREELEIETLFRPSPGGRQALSPKPETPPQDRQQDPLELQLRPTLYIGLGGAGMEVILRIRRRILSAVWGGENPIRIDTVAKFPIAQFIHFDLDHGAKVESDKSQVSDPLAERVKLSDEDKLIETFELDKYSRSEHDLSKYPHIEEWSPLTPLKIREKIRSKLNRLKAGLSNQERLHALGLKLDTTSFRIVVIGSVAGGTGAGTFLDVGYLARWVASNTVNHAEVDMMLFLPTGYQGANKERTEANGYASLMELETCMRGGSGYVARWENSDPLDLSDKPYRDVYLIDSGNLASQHLISSDQGQVYDMVADTLFEDLASVDFANKKRSVTVNQQQHKLLTFSPPVPGNRFGDMRLSYSRAYSSFGQAMLDTQGSVRRDIRAYRWAMGMVEVFFGVSGGHAGGNRATDKQRDEFMAAQIRLAPLPFTDLPEFSARDVRASRAEFTDYHLTEELLKDKRGSVVDGIQQRVADKLDNIAASFKCGEWSAQIRDLVKQLEHDVMREQGAAADAVEDRIVHKSKELFSEITAKLREQLYQRLDDKEFGGLEFVLSLVEQIKDRLENGNTGLAVALAANARRYAELRDALRTHEYEHLLGNLEQTATGFGLFRNKEEQAKLILKPLRQTIGDYLKFHLRAKAASQASDLLLKISHWLGERQNPDLRGNVRWTGLVGELQQGRGDVLAMLESIERKIGLLQEETKKDHAAYIRIETRDEKTALPPLHKLREWAEEVFRDMGASREVFPRLGRPEERERLIGLLRMKADWQISLPATEQPPEQQKDPLVDALEAMGAVRRQQRFEELLKRAMPWIDASWNDFKLRPDQFKCYIGVGNPADYRQFQGEIRTLMPTDTGITPDQLAFVATGMPGRMVCYCELSGIPLTVLRGMGTWLDSYRRESEKIPLHTHRDATRFTHPLAPTTNELNRLADDFQHYLLVVMLGVLVRDIDTKAVPKGASPQAVLPLPYLYSVSPGDARRMGNERAFRLNGLPPAYRQAIINDVDDKLGGLGGFQLGALAALAEFYAKEVYAPPLVDNESGAQVPVKGFASAIAEETAGRLRERASRKNLSAAELESIVEYGYEKIEAWTQMVKDSNTDAYGWEIKASMQPRLKRIVRPEFFQPGWLDGTLGVSSRPPVVSTTAPPPLHQYYLAVDGQQSGPHLSTQVQQWIASRQIDAAVLGWREGLAQWLPLGQIPELAALFAAVPTPPPLPGTPPPLP